MPLMKINAYSQAQLVSNLLDGDLTCAELAEVTGLHSVTVLEYCRELYRARAVHIVRWEADARGYSTVKVYKLGRGKDAPRPKLTPAAMAQARKTSAAALAAGTRRSHERSAARSLPGRAALGGSRYPAAPSALTGGPRGRVARAGPRGSPGT